MLRRTRAEGFGGVVVHHASQEVPEEEGLAREVGGRPQEVDRQEARRHQGFRQARHGQEDCAQEAPRQEANCQEAGAEKGAVAHENEAYRPRGLRSGQLDSQQLSRHGARWYKCGRRLECRGAPSTTAVIERMRQERTAGCLRIFTRMLRVLLSKHVPADT